MLTEPCPLARSIGPIHQLLTLRLLEGQPMIELQLDAHQIQFAANAEGDASPVTNEILLKRKAMT